MTVDIVTPDTNVAGHRDTPLGLGFEYKRDMTPGDMIALFTGKNTAD